MDDNPMWGIAFKQPETKARFDRYYFILRQLGLKHDPAIHLIMDIYNLAQAELLGLNGRL